MFTATWPEEVRQLAMDFMRPQPVMVTIGSQELSANTNITQHIHVIDAGQNKLQKLGSFSRSFVKLTRKLILVNVRRRNVLLLMIGSDLVICYWKR